MRLKSKAESTFPDKVVKVSVYMFVLQQDLIRHSDTGTLFFDNIAFPYFKGLPVTLVTVSLLSIPEWPQWTEKETRRPVPSHPWLGDPFPMSPIRYQQQHRIRGVFSVTFTGGNVSCPLFIKHFCPVANLLGEKCKIFTFLFSDSLAARWARLTTAPPARGRRPGPGPGPGYPCQWRPASPGADSPGPSHRSAAQWGIKTKQNGEWIIS